MMMNQKPTVYVPPWSSLFDDPSAAAGPVSGVSAGGGLFNEAALAALQRCGGGDTYDDFSDDSDVLDSAIDAYSCDEFRMYEFKVRRCARGRSHDWTECPYAHPGEKARRRDPRKYHYSGTACPDFRKGSCKRGDSCDMAHGVFECWLHPARYRTQPCKDGIACRRRVCFFAHTPDQLRVLPQSPKTPLESYDGSPLRQHQQLITAAAVSPPMSPTGGGGVRESLSPPMSPEAAAMRRASWPVNEVLASLRKLQLGKVKSMPGRGEFSLGFGSPRCGGGNSVSGGLRGGFCSLPSTPTGVVNGFMESGMDVISGRFTSTLNPFAAPYVPPAYRAVEDFSDEWWGLVKSSPWFRDYWLRECFEQEEEELDRTDPDFLDIFDDDTDSLFYSHPSLMSREGEEMKSKMEVAVLGAEKWRGPRGVMAGPRNCDKAVKIVNVKVSPRMIQQPR